MPQHIMVVDDDPDATDTLLRHLRTAGYEASRAGKGQTALESIRRQAPSLILLELLLSGMSGLEICKALKMDTEMKHIPVIILTSKSEEVDRIVALALGADDYITKPFNSRELILRIDRSLQRYSLNDNSGGKLVIGSLSLDHARHEVLADNKPVELTATEFKLLAMLMERRGQVQKREVILNDIWGYESLIETRTVDTHVRRLREKLGASGAYIETVRGVGYRIGESGMAAGSPVP